MVNLGRQVRCKGLMKRCVVRKQAEHADGWLAILVIIVHCPVVGG